LNKDGFLPITIYQRRNTAIHKTELNSQSRRICRVSE
jgi:hypothetical protein